MTATVTGYPASPAKKVSGTNASFSVNASISWITNTSGRQLWNKSYLTNVTIKIGDEEVENWTPTNTTTSTKSFDVKWDTTHFNCGNRNVECIATMRVERWLPVPEPDPPILAEYDTVGPLTSTAAVEVYNKGAACEFPRATSGNYANAEAVASFFNSIKHSGGAFTNADRDDCLDPLDDVTLYYFLGEGTAFPPTLCDLSVPWAIAGTNIQSKRADAQTAGLPPLNFAQLDACYTAAASTALSEALLYPTTNTTDRAVLAWKIEVHTEWISFFSGVLWMELSDCYSVSSAVDSAYEALYNQARGDDNMADPPANRSTALSICGDAHSRVHGLYNGQDGQNNAWYLVQ